MIWSISKLNHFPHLINVKIAHFRFLLFHWGRCFSLLLNFYFCIFFFNYFLMVFYNFICEKWVSAYFWCWSRWVVRRKLNSLSVNRSWIQIWGIKLYWISCLPTSDHFRHICCFRLFLMFFSFQKYVITWAFYLVTNILYFLC